MSLLRTLAIVFIVIGILGFILPGIPGDVLRWGILLAIICAAVEVVMWLSNKAAR